LWMPICRWQRAFYIECRFIPDITYECFRWK
jgi:hypothetical protein